MKRGIKADFLNLEMLIFLLKAPPPPHEKKIIETFNITASLEHKNHLILK